jgi:DNA polymerase-3 subunit epsilon
MSSRDLDNEFAAIPGSPGEDVLGYAVIDLETTGFSPVTDRVIEMAVVHTDASGEKTGEWVARFNPLRPVGATFVHGIRDEDIKGKPPLSEAIPSIVDLLRGRALAAHNASFDVAFLRAEFARSGWNLPDVPSICTLSASTRYLPQLHRRKLDDCCRAIGVEFEARHAALPDAHAAASLLAWFLDPGKAPAPDPGDLTLPAAATGVPWPSAPDGPPRSPEQNAARERGAARRFRISPKPLSQPLMSLLRDYPLTDAVEEGAPTNSLPYLEMLLEVLEDGIVTVGEGHDLAGLAQAHGMSPDDITRAHRGFLLAMGHLAVADGTVAREEREEMLKIAKLLGEPEDLIPGILSDARLLAAKKSSEGLAPLPEDWVHGEPLRIGDGVAFTGCDDVQRTRLEEAARVAGVRVTGGVSGKTAILVSDGSMDGTKAAKARELGTRVVHPDAFEVLLLHVQPAIDLDPAAKARHDTSKMLPRQVDPNEVRAWAKGHGYEIGDRGRIRRDIIEAYLAAMHSTGPTDEDGTS